jgi:hypothetical protein
MAKIITENFKVETTKEMFSTFTSKNDTIAANFLTGLNTYVANNAGVTLTTAQKNEIQDIVEGQLATNIPVASYYIVGSSIDKANAILNTQVEKRDFQRRVIFGNKVSEDNIRYMFYKNAWLTGTIYDDFDDTQDISTINNIVTVSNSEGDYEVFKCLENNNGSASTSTPSFTGVDPNSYEQIFSGDGYVWKYLFTVSAGDDIVFGTSDSLPLPYPSYGNTDVITAAKEDISQIIIENTQINLFQQYRFGPSNSTTDSSTVSFQSIVQSATSANVADIRVRATPKPGFSLYTGNDSYKNMYLLQTDSSGAMTVYDILGSSTPNSPDLDIDLKINTTDGNSPNLFKNDIFQIVPKINVTRSTSSGTPCVAYGIIDQFGTLKRVAFKSKGSEYKFATATLALPTAVATNYTPAQAATLRCVISPTGGHGSDMISELAMSRLAVITNFSGEDVAIPDANSYTKVGLIKNPSFTDSTLPTQFDNRTTIVISGDHTATALPGYYVQQTVALDTTNNEVITARIHESVFSGGNTTIHLVDYYGDFKNTFQTGIISVKANLSTTTASTLTINNASTDVTYGKYSPYTGQVLHFVDFDPIQRQATRKEKIKFIFDF